MKLSMEKFGNLLFSRPAGREAALAALAYSIPKEGTEKIKLDFTIDDVLTPSWTDEFLQTLDAHVGKDRINVIEGENPSVIMTMKTLRELG